MHNDGMDILIFYLIVINTVSFLLYGLDKLRAVRHERRIRERTLLMAAAAGGSLGAALGMLIFRHKIRKSVFRVTVPLCLIVHVILLFLLKSRFF